MTHDVENDTKVNQIFQISSQDHQFPQNMSVLFMHFYSHKRAQNQQSQALQIIVINDFKKYP